MHKRIVLFLAVMMVVLSLSARSCVEMMVNFFPEKGSEVASSELILIDLFGLLVYFHDTISNTRLYAVTESGKRDEVEILDSRKGGHNCSQFLVKLTFQQISEGDVFWLEIEDLPSISHKEMTVRLRKYFEETKWNVVAKDQDMSAPIIPEGIRYKYISGWPTESEYQVKGRLEFIENDVEYYYHSENDTVPNMLVRVTNSKGTYYYLPLKGGEFVWGQGWCSSKLPEIDLSKTHEFRLRLMDMSGNQLEEQNKLIVF